MNNMDLLRIHAVDELGWWRNYLARKQGHHATQLPSGVVHQKITDVNKG